MKQSKSLFTFLTGLAVGAAAVFFAKKKNRETAQEYMTVAKKQLHSWAKEYKKDPEAFKQRMLDEGHKIADDTMRQIKQLASELTEIDAADVASKVEDAAKKAKKTLSKK